MTEDLNMVMDMAKEAMEQSINHLKEELTKIRAGRATPSMLHGVMVDYYGTLTPLQQVANINTLDARTITVQPWEKGMLDPISTAITNANLGLNPQNNGEMIIISVPVLTTERRQELVKKAKAVGENAKVGIRSARKDANDEVKGMEKDGLSEDMAKTAEGNIQDLTNSYNGKVDAIIDAKEADIMKV